MRGISDITFSGRYTGILTETHTYSNCADGHPVCGFTYSGKIQY